MEGENRNDDSPGERQMRMTRTVLAACVALTALSLAACNPASETAAAPAGADAATLSAENETLKARIAALEADKAAMTAPHADAGPGLYFVNLKDGDTVTSPVRVVFGLYGKGIAPAGIEKENTGHHHLLIDTQLSDEEMTFAIPNDPQHLHFGLGQTETMLELTPGTHTLQLVMGDLKHEQLKPPLLSQKITITVK